MNIPVLTPCPVLMYPRSSRYAESIRQFQGCPTIAISRGGRIFAGWYSGGNTEPHADNYNLIVISDDQGKTWSSPIAVIPSDKRRCIHALDIQLWTDPSGRLWVFWVQERMRRTLPGDTTFHVDGYTFQLDQIHGEWAMVCENPDADTLVFSAPRRLDHGFLRCKPLALKSGRWINFNYDQTCDRYGYSISDDQGQTWTRHYGAEKIPTPFDEAMAVEKNDGSIHMMARTYPEHGALAESVSHDGGLTWSKARLSQHPDPCSRFFYSRTPSGNLLLVRHGVSSSRKDLTVCLSADDGKTWPWQVVVDSRENVSYPDADFYGGKIYLLHDFERNRGMEILLSVFTEEDVIKGRKIQPVVISKP